MALGTSDGFTVTVKVTRPPDSGTSPSTNEPPRRDAAVVELELGVEPAGARDAETGAVLLPRDADVDDVAVPCPTAASSDPAGADGRDPAAYPHVDAVADVLRGCDVLGPHLETIRCRRCEARRARSGDSEDVVRGHTCAVPRRNTKSSSPAADAGGAATTAVTSATVATSRIRLMSLISVILEPFRGAPGGRQSSTKAPLSPKLDDRGLTLSGGRRMVKSKTNVPGGAMSEHDPNVEEANVRSPRPSRTSKSPRRTQRTSRAAAVRRWPAPAATPRSPTRRSRTPGRRSTAESD